MSRVNPAHDVAERTAGARRRAGRARPRSDSALRRTTTLFAALKGLMRRVASSQAAGSGLQSSAAAVPILVVEDDPPTRQYLETALSLEGYRVTTAATGREALERLDSAPRPRLILLDWMMPEMDGAKFWRTLQARP